MTGQEREARAYCAAIGADPDEIVRGYWDAGNGRCEWVEAARFSWYLGVSVVGLRRPI